jgi:hypothetical protein
MNHIIFAGVVLVTILGCQLILGYVLARTGVEL